MIDLKTCRSLPDRAPCLTFAPLAWLKLQYFCHTGPTEVGGFGISADDDLLYVEDFIPVGQETTPVSVRFRDEALADFFDRCTDAGLPPRRFARVWCHTHPGHSVTPSSTDEETFERVFGGCDWAMMFILGRGGQSYARLAFTAGPGGSLLLPTSVDWARWPDYLGGPTAGLDRLVGVWPQEYAANVRALPEPTYLPRPGEAIAFPDNGVSWPPWDRGLDPDDFFPEPMPEVPPHESADPF